MNSADGLIGIGCCLKWFSKLSWTLAVIGKEQLPNNNFHMIIIKLYSPREMYFPVLLILLGNVITAFNIIGDELLLNFGAKFQR